MIQNPVHSSDCQIFPKQILVKQVKKYLLIKIPHQRIESNFLHEANENNRFSSIFSYIQYYIYTKIFYYTLYTGIHCSQMTQHYRKTHLDYKTQGTLLHESTWYRQGFHRNFWDIISKNKMSNSFVSFIQRKVVSK